MFCASWECIYFLHRYMALHVSCVVVLASIVWSLFTIDVSFNRFIPGKARIFSIIPQNLLPFLKICIWHEADSSVYKVQRVTFVYPRIIIFVNDDQQDATILAYLFIPNQLYMFRAMSSPIIRSTWLY